MDIRIEHTLQPKVIPQHVDSFGKIFTDHMFVMDYTEGRGWHDPRIVPFDSFSYSPAASIFHYGQGIFEGLKAYKDEDDAIRLFRPEANFERLNKSARRLSMPEVDVSFMVKALEELIRLEKKWVPKEKGTSLYIRPFMIAADTTLGVHSSKTYQLAIILSPSGPYYKNGLAPVDILVEEELVRAVRGGLGEAKTMANYAASILAGERAEQLGFTQVLWLDGVYRRYIEEVGTMNIMFYIDGIVHTPQLNGSILPGITRDSILKILKEEGVPVKERQISIEEIVEASQQGTLQEMFGTGTAAVISPVASLHYQGKKLAAQSPYDASSLSQHLYQKLTDIQNGRLEDTFGWVKVIG